MRLSWFFYFGRWLARLLLLSLTRWEIRGLENVPASGPLIIVANHLSLADPPVVGASVPRKMMFMAKKELFHPWPAGYFMRSFGAFPVHRGALDRAAVEKALSILQAGMAVAMFPEGTRSRSVQLQTAFPGSALIALRSGAPVLPVAISGTERLRGRGGLHRPHILVSIGRPFTLAPSDAGLAKGAVQEASSTIMRAVARLLPPAYRGVYSEGDHAPH